MNRLVSVSRASCGLGAAVSDLVLALAAAARSHCAGVPIVLIGTREAAGGASATTNKSHFARVTVAGRCR